MARLEISSVTPVGREERIDSNFTELYSAFDPATGALATNATTGFLYLPTCAGTPTGVPTGVSGRVALVYDTSNDILYIYNGSWKGITALWA